LYPDIFINFIVKKYEPERRGLESKIRVAGEKVSALIKPIFYPKGGFTL